MLTVPADQCLVAPAGLRRVHFQKNVTLASYKTSIISDNGDNLGMDAQSFHSHALCSYLISGSFKDFVCKRLHGQTKVPRSMLS